MIVESHQLTAALYLVAGLVAGLGLALPSRRLERVAVGLLVAGALAHAGAFGLLHVGKPPPLTDTAAALSFVSWIGTLAFLVLMRRGRLAGLVALVAPMAFLGVFFAAMRLPDAEPATFGGSSSWGHAHVLLSGAGLALLGLAGLAGLLFLAEHRLIKSKRQLDLLVPLPSLEALDRVNVSALALGFPLLTLGVVTGMMWVQQASGRIWQGAPHETWSMVAWAVYAVLATARFWAHQGARQAAASAVLGSAFLFFAVVGVGLLA